MSDTTEKDIEFIRALAEMLREHDLGEIEVTREYGDDDELKVRLSRHPNAAIPAPVATPVAVASPLTSTPPAGEPPAEAPETAPEADGTAVTSPMVGTVYLAAEPGAEPFVRVGDQVTEGQTLVIIEAMKTMNQIPSPSGGTVRAIHVRNGEPVEFGAPLVMLE